MIEVSNRAHARDRAQNCVHATRSRALGALLLLAGVPAASVAAPAQAEPVPPAVPAALEVPAGHRAFLVSHAFGTQNYTCLPRATGTGNGWTFAGPQATLYDAEYGQLMTHYLSVAADGVPRATWQHSRDSSAVRAAAVASSTDPAFVTPGAIPWLLLRIVDRETGLAGGDRMAQTTFMQRVNTVEGTAPAGDCATVGSRIFVPYETDYVFYRAH